MSFLHKRHFHHIASLRYDPCESQKELGMTDTKPATSLPNWIKEHIELYLKDGEAAHLWDASFGKGAEPLTTLLLTTVGRRSGNTVHVPLIYRHTDSGGYCVIASKGGAPEHPAWFLNLQAQATVSIKVAADSMTAVARVAEGEEREHLWEMMADYFSNYREYQAATERQIPVVVLEPVVGDAE